jgi:hypothetical protein
MQKWFITMLCGSLLGVGSACGPGLQGGRQAEANYAPKVVVEYRAEGDAPTGIRYALVREGDSLAILKVSPGAPPMLIDRRWQDSNGYHFVMWSPTTEAEHILVPPQPGAIAFRWTYPPGLYEVTKQNEIARPVPKIPLEAVTKLTPVGAR